MTASCERVCILSPLLREHALVVGVVDVEARGCSVSGDLGSALNVLTRMVNMGHKPTVHVYNSLIQACERHQNYDLALHYARCLELDGLVPNEHTKRLLQVGPQDCVTVKHFCFALHLCALLGVFFRLSLRVEVTRCLPFCNLGEWHVLYLVLCCLWMPFSAVFRVWHGAVC